MVLSPSPQVTLKPPSPTTTIRKLPFGRSSDTASMFKVLSQQYKPRAFRRDIWGSETSCDLPKFTQ